MAIENQLTSILKIVLIFVPKKGALQVVIFVFITLYLLTNQQLHSFFFLIL